MDSPNTGKIPQHQNEVGNNPQSGVDAEVKKDEPSRAHAIEGAGPVGVIAIETQSQQIEKTASQAILQAFASSGAIAAKVMSVIEAGFTATRPQFNKATQGWDEIPDYKTQLAAVELYLAHTVGLPIQRTENLNLTGKLPGAEKRKPATPAMLKYYERELEKAKRQGGAKDTPPAGAT